ncbi:MAG: tetratricopeptide repeat protein [bacterium]|nr:tetratricopeptide repeat protein [bacterium]
MTQRTAKGKPRSSAHPEPCGSVRPSRRGRWRALSLVLIHVVAGLHVAHWYATGKTITPVEPSEAMQTLGQGLVNAGFVLFALLILSTLVFGRFFCGWGCHLVALQDLCTWMLRKVGIRPRPFRSRLLVFVPLLAAIWMFVAPTLVRMWIGRPPPELQPHFETHYFWDRFPGLFVALLTFAVCGFVIVYILGNKGFCTYACPYGGIFGLADQIAPGKIRVTDACDGCGHCTATCTSNVRVAEEVRVHGMVVDPGCMKCMDCTDVCPRGALYFGFGKPTLRKTERATPRKVAYDYTWPEEALLALTFLGSVVILRALYDAVPFLLALGLAAISAYALVTATRLLYRKDVRHSGFRLRASGRTTPAGAVVLGCVVLWVLFLAHSGWVQYLTLNGSRLVSSGVSLAAAGSPADGAGRTSRGIELLLRSEKLGLVTPTNLLGRIASGYSHLGRNDRAEEYYRRAVLQSPGYAAARYELARRLGHRGDKEAGAEQLLELVRRRPEFPGAHDLLAEWLLELGRGEQALAVVSDLRRERPEELSIQLTHGIVLAQTGRPEEARVEIAGVLERAPELPRAHFHLGQILAHTGEFEPALAAFERAAELAPQDPESRYMSAKVAARLERWATVRDQLEPLLPDDPFNAEYVRPWAHAVARTGGLEAAIELAEQAGEIDRGMRFRLAFLYTEAGRTEEARGILAEFSAARAE